MRYMIRELTLGGILDQAINLTKDHIGVFLGITGVLLIPWQAITGLIQLALAPALPPNPTPEQILAAASAGMSVSIPVLLVAVFLIAPITNAALIFAVSDAYLGKPISVVESFKRVFQRILGLIGTWLLVILSVWGGLILCVVPGILAAFAFGLATQVVVVERMAGTAAMRRSKQLMSGNVGTFFILGLILGPINFGLSFAAGLIPQPHLRVIATALIVGALTIFSSAVYVVFYFSCRCKHEQFDLALLAQSVGAEKPADLTGDPTLEF